MARVLLKGTDDPTSVSQDADKDSLYAKTDTGEVYIKLDDGDTTNWADASSMYGRIA